MEWFWITVVYLVLGAIALLVLLVILYWFKAAGASAQREMARSRRGVT